MLAPMPIRIRLTLWYVAVLLAGLALFGAGMWLMLEHRLVTNLDARLTARVDGLRALLKDEGGARNHGQLQDELTEYAREAPEGAFVQVQDARGAVLLQARPPQLNSFMSGRPIFRVERIGTKSYRVLTDQVVVDNQTYYVRVASSIDELVAVLRDFRQLLLLLAPAVVLLACAGGYWLSARALSPVDAITSQAKSITLQNLSERLSVPATRDEVQRLADTWNEMLERLDASVRRIRQFTADASHELRTPLALIHATAELSLRRERSADEYRDSLRQIQGDTQRLTAVTESLLTLARSDSGSLQLTRAPLDMNSIVREFVRQVVPAAEERGIHLYTRLPDHAAVASGDEAGIRRVLLALTDNALKYTPAGGNVELSVLCCEQGVRLVVEDTGAGIPLEAQPHIFERFFRTEPARSEQAGAGLGLAIAQAIIQAHGSEITVESTPGHGSRFAFLLPA